MKFALIGRSQLALLSGASLLGAGHDLRLVATAKPAEYYDATPGDFEQLARRAGASFLLCPQFDSDADVARLRTSDAEIGVSVNWPAVLGPEPIAAFPRGILNAHAGDLPRYRGNACVNWAILNGESRVGLCVHEMAPNEIDSGPVVVRDWLPLNPDSYVGDVMRWLEQRIPQMFVEAVGSLERGAVVPQPQPADPARSLRCYPRRPEDSRIDWCQPAAAVHRLIRASSRPFAGAYAFLEGERRVTVWRAELFDHPGPYLAVPGQILMRHESAPVVACGAGCLRLTEVTLEGEPDTTRAQQALGGRLRARLQ